MIYLVVFLCGMFFAFMCGVTVGLLMDMIDVKWQNRQTKGDERDR